MLKKSYMWSTNHTIRSFRDLQHLKFVAISTSNVKPALDLFSQDEYVELDQEVLNQLNLCRKQEHPDAPVWHRR
jgi:hypothetical protein